MRKYRIDENYIKLRYNTNSKPFWDSCEKGFEEMFTPQARAMNRIGPHCYEADPDDEDTFENRKSGGQKDWSWYVQQRISYSNHFIEKCEPHYFEDLIYKWFSSETKAKDKPILLIHGNTGIGKTTIAKYFFSSYLKQRDADLASKTYFFRVSYPSIKYDMDMEAEDFDHYLYRCLIETFKTGDCNLGDPAVLVKMALLMYPFDENFKRYITIENPPPKAYPAQLRWIREIVMGRSKQSSDFEDFNSLAIRYLCSKDRNIKIVIFLDNVDQLPASVQVKAWLLANQKLKWIKKWDNVFFIISMRTYLLNNALKESELSAYSDQLKKIQIMAPSLYDVLYKRKEVFFDPVFPKRTESNKMDIPKCKMTIPAINLTFPLYCPNEMLSSLIDAFKETAHDSCISLICNFDIRQGIEIAKALCQYPFYKWKTLAELVYKQYMAFNHKSDSNSLISFERILDAALRKTNILCDTTIPFFDNMYKVSNIDHFSNSLCKMFILYIIQKGAQKKVDLIEILERLGHPRNLINTAISRLLKCNIITSPEGTDIDKVIELSSENTTLCEQYIRPISCTLYYLQAMAYDTPMSEDYYDQIPLPTEINNDDRMFEDRVKAAGILLKQIEDDLKEQTAYIESIEDKIMKAKCKHIMEFYDLKNLVLNIKSKVKEDLGKLLSSNSNMYDNNIGKLYSLFNISDEYEKQDL